MEMNWPGAIELAGMLLGLTLFYAIYESSLRRLTFFGVNRSYLLLLPALCWLIPAAQFSVTSPAGTASGSEHWTLTWQQFMTLYSNQGEPTSITEALLPSIAEIIVLVYWIGVAIALISLAVQYLRLWLFISRQPQEKQAGWTRVLVPGNFPVASFFQYVLQPEGEELKEAILQHELTHIRRRHSWDLLWMEIWVSLHWFNPLVYKWRQCLREVHEYEADAAVVKQGNNAFQYASLLTRQPTMVAPAPGLHLFAAQLTERLRMLGRNRNTSWQLIRYALSLPIVGVLLTLFSFEVIAEGTVQEQVAALPSVTIKADKEQLSNAPAAAFTTPTPNKKADASVLNRAESTREIPTSKDQLDLEPLPVRQDTVPPPMLSAKGKVTIAVDGDSTKIYADSLTFNPKATATAKSEGKPLLVVDGKVIGKMDGGDVDKKLNDIKPDSIEKVEVFKGQTAIDLYGEAGRDGVIVITTKGKKKKEKE
ncbi:MAG: hypothetical protein H6555_03305 [Lewinellaceae bacterium]|nr:hypothetical protein [Lewinellaceae bacterium]